MIKVLAERIRQGYRTMPYPRQEPSLPDRFRGRPAVDCSRCPQDCRACEEACPTNAILAAGDAATPGAGRRLQVDMGRCLFCTDCAQACTHGSITHSVDYKLAARSRQDLIVGNREGTPMPALDDRLRRLLGRSLKLRQVSAGGCNGCEADLNVLNTVGFDLGRFGIQFVASPRHADGLLVTGPVTKNMELALRKTYEAVPQPKIVIASGACAISGGPYAGHPEVHNGVDGILPVDLHIPGCPPHPMTVLDGLLRLLGRR